MGGRGAWGRRAFLGPSVESLEAYVAPDSARGQERGDIQVAVGIKCGAWNRSAGARDHHLGAGWQLGRSLVLLCIERGFRATARRGVKIAGIDEIEQMFDDRPTMTALSPDVTAALATLRTRWGAAAPQRMGEPIPEAVGEVVGALATVPLPDLDTPSRPADIGRVVGTGFAELDAILGPGGVPRSTSLALRGADSSGRTTLALRLAAEAQSAGSIVAWVDLARSFDPVEAVARGVTLDWLVVLTPGSVDEGLAMAGSLLGGRTVDLLVVDLPASTSGAPSVRPSAFADRLHRLAALARRSEAILVVLEPPGIAAAVGRAVAESAGLRLELARRAWIRLGRDVVGQRTEVTVARNRFGLPGRRAELRILYADGGERDR